MDTSSCPGSCSWYDWVYTTDSCLQYLACADPSDARYQCAVLGALGCGGKAFGTGVANAVTGVGSGLTTGAAANPTGLLVIAAVVIGAVLLLKK